jgi:hypothetical protein
MSARSQSTADQNEDRRFIGGAEAKKERAQRTVRELGRKYGRAMRGVPSSRDVGKGSTEENSVRGARRNEEDATVHTFLKQGPGTACEGLCLMVARHRGTPAEGAMTRAKTTAGDGVAI